MKDCEKIHFLFEGRKGRAEIKNILIKSKMNNLEPSILDSNFPCYETNMNSLSVKTELEDSNRNFFVNLSPETKTISDGMHK